MRELND